MSEPYSPVEIRVRVKPAPLGFEGWEAEALDAHGDELHTTFGPESHAVLLKLVPSMAEHVEDGGPTPAAEVVQELPRRSPAPVDGMGEAAA